MSSQLERINEDVRSFVERANSEQRGLRVVPLGVAWEVARRSLTQTEEQPFSVRRFRALSAVSDFVSLAQRNKLTTLTVDNSDLLPVAHPASTRKHRMSQFDVLRAQARWYADDARVEDSVVASALLSTLFTESADTPEYEYTYARLAALTAGGLPVMALVAVAFGFNDGANRGYWRQQIRDRKGRWAEMGGGISINISRNGRVYKQTGQVVSTDAKNGRVRFRTPDNRIVDVDTDSFNVDEDVQGIVPSKGTSDGVSAEPVRVGSDEVVIPEADLSVVDSPNGFDRADGSGLPGGMDESQVGEVWQDDLGNYQVARGSFRDGEGEEFVVSRLEEGRVVPLASGGDWNDVQRIIDEDEPKFKKGTDAEPNFPEGFDLTPSAEAADAPESGGDDDGPYQVDRGPYEPRGPREDVDSEGYTDDPADLATQFTPEQIGDALKSAVNEGSGVGFIEFDSDRGDEEVPAEALYNALKVQGVDADQFLDDVEAGKDVKASLPKGADIPGLDEPRNRRFEDAKFTRKLLGDEMPALLQGLSDRELQALIEQDYDFRSLVDANKDRDVPEGFYKLNEADYDPLGSIPGAPDEMRPFELSLEFSAEQLEEQLRAAVGPDAERSGYGRFEMPDSDGESESFDVPAEAIADALKLHAIDTNQLLDEVYDGGEPTVDEVNDMIQGEEVEEDADGGESRGPDGDGRGPSEGERVVPESDDADGRGPEDDESPWSSLGEPLPKSEREQQLEELGRVVPELFELDSEQDAEAFRDMLEGLKEDNPYFASVYVYDLEEYEEMRLFSTADGKAGFALKPNGDIVSVYVYPNSKHKGGTVAMLGQAVAQGGDRLDAYDTVLPKIYADAGFRPVARVGWNDDFAPDNWDKKVYSKYNNGAPDVVAMAYEEGRLDSDYDPEEGELFEDYDAAMAARDAVLDGDEAKPESRTPESILRDIGVPESPGAVDIPEGAVRLFHYTRAPAVEKIREEGLIAQEDGPAARDQEPAMIWALQDEPVGGEGQFRLKPIVEFQVPEEVWNSGPLAGYALIGPVSPDNIIAIHEPWHRQARDIVEEGFSAEEIANGVLDQYDIPGIRKRAPDFVKAVDKIKELFNLEPIRDSEASPPEPRPFGEETQELDISGDLEVQVNDALENQRELEFAYAGSTGEPTARLVRPVRLETNERTDNVNLLAVDDEGNFEKFTLSKVQPLSDAEESRDNVSGDETPGDEVEVDDASISAENKQMFVEAQSGVVDDVYAGNLKDSFDVEDAGEQDGVNDNVTSDIAQGVDDSAEAADAPNTVEERAVSDVLQEALSGEDARVPSLDNLLSDLGDEDEYDPDIIWQSVSDTYGGKVLENGHIVVSSTMHGDRRYDVVVRRDSNNTFHVFHRVTYPDNTSKVREMGDLGWHSTKALFDKIDKQVVNSVSRPKTTVNKNLKPENNRTLFADNPSPKRKDSFVAADGSILSEGDRVVVSKENHSKAGMGARIIRAENEFDSKQYRYTDYVRVKYDDGEKNWIVSQSLLPESGTPESEREAEPAPENILPSVSTSVDGLSEISVGLNRVFDLLPSSSKVVGDPDVEDVEVQKVAAFINNLSVRSEFESDRLREKAEQSSNDVLVEAQVLKSLSDKASALVSAGVRLKEAGKNSPRSSFYLELSDQLTAAGDNLQGSVDDRTPEIRQEFEQRLSQLVPENLRVSPDDVTFDAVDGFVSDIVNRLPEGDKFAQYQSTRPDVLETPVYQKEGAYHLDNFLSEVRANENDVLSVGLADLDAARDVFDGNPEMSAVVSDLDSLKTAILRGRAGRADTPFAAPDLEELDPLEVRDGRIASGENSFAPGEEFSSYILESANAEGITVLSDFRQEVADFFDGSERSLAEISPRGRVALQKFADDELKNNPLLSPPVFNDMVDLLKKLESEDRAYFPQRTEVGSDVDSLRGLSFPLDIIKTPRGQDVLDDNGDPTGWTVAERDSDGVNEAIQLRNNSTGQLLWVKQEMSEGNARSEYASSRISQLMGFSGAPIVEIVKNDPKLLFITQAGDTVRLNGDAERYSDVYGEFGPPSSQLKDIALLDIVKMSIMDTAIDNGDRHGGNFLVGVKDQLGVGDDSGATRLFPIDHGMGNAFLFDRLTSTEEYLTNEGSSGGALARLLAESMGGARFKELTGPIIDDLVAGLRNEINDNFYSNNPNVFRGMTAVIDRLEEYKNLDVSVFESLQP